MQVCYLHFLCRQVWSTQNNTHKTIKRLIIVLFICVEYETNILLSSTVNHLSQFGHFSNHPVRKMNRPKPPGDIGGWQKVTHRRNRSPDKGVSQETTIFISNLPEGCTSNLLWKIFKSFGHMLDAYIPQQKDKVGNFFLLSFGFWKSKTIIGWWIILTRWRLMGQKLRLMLQNMTKMGTESGTRMKETLVPPSLRMFLDLIIRYIITLLIPIQIELAVDAIRMPFVDPFSHNLRTTQNLWNRLPFPLNLAFNMGYGKTVP